MLYQKEISVKYETDVFVAGGGPSGVAAAVAAAALAVEKEDTISVKVSELQNSLKKLGAYLPNAL